VFVRANGAWAQQGSKLVGTGAVGTALQVYSVALSNDGNTAITGGPSDNNGTSGASWIFTRSGGTWSQQGNKLIGTGASAGGAGQGISVSLSADGNTAVSGGDGDNGDLGAAWVFTRNGSSWSQFGPKLVGTGTVGLALEGHSVALSADAKTLVLGGYYDNGQIGATWVFAQPGAGLGASTHDFNGDARSDILWRDGGGNVAQWLMNGGTIAATSVIGTIPPSWSVVGQRWPGRHSLARWRRQRCGVADERRYGVLRGHHRQYSGELVGGRHGRLRRQQQGRYSVA
jgi:hypothetical protein